MKPCGACRGATHQSEDRSVSIKCRKRTFLLPLAFETWCLMPDDYFNTTTEHFDLPIDTWNFGSASY